MQCSNLLHILLLHILFLYFLFIKVWIYFTIWEVGIDNSNLDMFQGILIFYLSSS